MEKPILLVSFSGGRTSAMMLKWCYDNLQDQFQLITVFANTGKERPGTLDFVQKCSDEWGIDIVWVEARHFDDSGKPYSKKGWSVKHRVVSYETASRNGEPFEEMIKALGIPSTNAPFCSDQLKRKAIESYMKDAGILDFYKAIGLRAGEVDRINPKFKKLKIIYPFITMKPTWRDNVIAYWDRQSFDLEIEVDLGNCDACWKKDEKRLVRIARNNKTVFDWWQKMTDKYGHYNPRNTPLDPPFNFYRGNLSPKDLIKMSNWTMEEIQEFQDACQNHKVEKGALNPAKFININLRLYTMKLKIESPEEWEAIASEAIDRFLEDFPKRPGLTRPPNADDIYEFDHELDFMYTQKAMDLYDRMIKRLDKVGQKLFPETTFNYHPGLIVMP